MFELAMFDYPRVGEAAQKRQTKWNVPSQEIAKNDVFYCSEMFLKSIHCGFVYSSTSSTMVSGSISIVVDCISATSHGKSYCKKKLPRCLPISSSSSTFDKTSPFEILVWDRISIMVLQYVQGGAPPVISWFINHISKDISSVNHSEMEVINQLS